MNISIWSKLQDVQKLRKSNFDIAYSIKRQTGLGNPIPVCFWLSKSPRTFSCLKRKDNYAVSSMKDLISS